MRSREEIIPAILTDLPALFKERLDFASTKRSVHFDIIDGEFCRGDITLPLELWPEVKTEYSEAHLMVNKPSDYLKKLAEKRVTRAIVHIESHFDSDELRQKARQYDILLGFAVSLQTDLHKLRPFFEISSYIQVMGVQPGKVGQHLNDATIPALNYLKKLTPYRLILTVDGGVNKTNIRQLKDAGADYFITSSALFGTGSLDENYEELKTLLNDNKTA